MRQRSAVQHWAPPNNAATSRSVASPQLVQVPLGLPDEAAQQSPVQRLAGEFLGEAGRILLGHGVVASAGQSWFPFPESDRQSQDQSRHAIIRLVWPAFRNH